MPNKKNNKNNKQNKECYIPLLTDLMNNNLFSIIRLDSDDDNNINDIDNICNDYIELKRDLVSLPPIKPIVNDEIEGYAVDKDIDTDYVMPDLLVNVMFPQQNSVKKTNKKKN